MRQIKADPFYLSKEWRRRRKKVLAEFKYECQYCKAKGKYKRATHVHHEFQRDKYPQYELDEMVTLPDGTHKRNLVPVCKDCHETVCHPERLRWNKKPELNEERW